MFIFGWPNLIIYFSFTAAFSFAALCHLFDSGGEKNTEKRTASVSQKCSIGFQLTDFPQVADFATKIFQLLYRTLLEFVVFSHFVFTCFHNFVFTILFSSPHSPSFQLISISIIRDLDAMKFSRQISSRESTDRSEAWTRWTSPIAPLEPLMSAMTLQSDAKSYFKTSLKSKWCFDPDISKSLRIFGQRCRDLYISFSMNNFPTSHAHGRSGARALRVLLPFDLFLGNRTFWAIRVVLSTF